MLLDDLFHGGTTEWETKDRVGAEQQVFHQWTQVGAEPLFHRNTESTFVCCLVVDGSLENGAEWQFADRASGIQAIADSDPSTHVDHVAIQQRDANFQAVVHTGTIDLGEDRLHTKVIFIPAQPARRFCDVRWRRLKLPQRRFCAVQIGK